MRKKSAFLERLTARAAAAFEAGGSYGAYDSKAEESSPAYTATQPSGAASLHEPSMRYSAQADAQSNAVLPHTEIASVGSPVVLGTELSTQLDAHVHTEQGAKLRAEQSTGVGTEVHAGQDVYESTQQSPEVDTEQSTELGSQLDIQLGTQQDTEVHTEATTKVEASQSTELSTQQDINENPQLNTEQNTELHIQDVVAEVARPSNHTAEPVNSEVHVANTERSAIASVHPSAVLAEQDSQDTSTISQALEAQSTILGADLAEEHAVLDEHHTTSGIALNTELSTQQNTQAHSQTAQQDSVQFTSNQAKLSSQLSTQQSIQQSAQVHTEQKSNDNKAIAEPISTLVAGEIVGATFVGQSGVPPEASASHVGGVISPSGPSREQAAGQLVAQPTAHSMAQSGMQAMMPVIDSDEERICASLGDVAKVLFAHLIAMEKNVLNMKRLRLYNHNNLPIPYTSIRTAWTRLKTLKIISHSARHDIGKEKGVLFQLDGVYTFAFQKLYPHMLVRVRAGQNMGQSAQLSTELHAGLSAGLSSGLSVEQGSQLSPQLSTQLHAELNPQQGAYLSTQLNPQVSSQSGTQLHTQQGTQLHTQVTSIPEIPKTKLEGHPEYAFWRDCGLTQTQCTRWKEEFGLDDLLLDNYLRWCAHDVGHDERKDKNGKTISNPANWFYTIMKKAGAYPKPEGYQSHEEKIFLVRESLLKEQAALHARQNDLRAQEERQEAEALFAAFLEEGESSQQFHELCAKISPFLYENRHTRRRLFENALRTEYFAFLGIDAGHKD
ncbi:MAG: hypothetical protein R3Y11_08610 [Pseudomonadota bacterium]